MSKTQIRILLIEDNTADAQLIRDFLSEAMSNDVNTTHFQVTHAKRLEDGLTHLDTNIFDVILLDLSLPDSFGLGTFERLLAHDSQTPIIVLTGLNDELLAMDAMQQGAQDYLVKQDVTNSALLVRAIRYAIERQRLVAELAQKANELEMRNNALDAFSHTMAHQIRGPLSQVIGYAEFAEATFGAGLNNDVLTILRRILHSGLKMNNMLSELLLLASVRSQSEVELLPLNMGRIVAEVRKRLRLQLDNSQAQIHLPRIWPIAVGHAPWIEEVWVNYITNGLKYGGNPPILKLGADEPENGMICFWVQDNGRGISSDDQTRLFKPHTRLQDKRVRGEGLGLSIVHRIVYRLGGEVGVNSKLGSGSTFWFTLPAASPDSIAKYMGS